jgi:hypothetical protein
MSTVTATPPRAPASARNHHASRASVRSVLASYVKADTGTTREIVCRHGAAGSTLVIDRVAANLSDPRLVAHLAADEPPANARLVCDMYLADENRGACRPVSARDRRCPPGFDLPPSTSDQAARRTALADRHGRTYAIREVGTPGTTPELRWTRSSARKRGAFEVVRLREVVGALEDYEPARSITIRAIAAGRPRRRVSTERLRGELDRLASSHIVLNRGLRERVQQETASGELSLSQIAIRCGRTKRDKRGNISGETSWLSRRIGLTPEGGYSEPTPWVHTEVLARIARQGLCASPREVELGLGDQPVAPHLPDLPALAA